MDLQSIVIKEITDVMTVHQSQGKKIEIKDRVSYAISLSTGGKIRYTHRDKVYLSDVDRVIFHPKHGSYTLDCIKSGSFPLIEFEIASPHIEEFAEFKVSNSKQFLRAFEEMKNNFLRHDKTAKNMSILYDIFDALTPISRNVSDSIIYPAVIAINNEFANAELNISFLAKLCHVSECYFRRKFFESFGMSPKKYLTEKRIKYAVQLLKEGDLNITQIAEKCGYSNVYHFSKIFKENMSITASEFAQKNVRQEM